MKMLTVFLLSFFTGVAMCEDDESMALVCCALQIISFANDYCRKKLGLSMLLLYKIK